jgi:hypothetical protein
MSKERQLQYYLDFLFNELHKLKIKKRFISQKKAISSTNKLIYYYTEKYKRFYIELAMENNIDNTDRKEYITFINSISIKDIFSEPVWVICGAEHISPTLFGFLL